MEAPVAFSHQSSLDVPEKVRLNFPRWAAGRIF